MRTVDRFAVDMQPLSHAAQAALHDIGDGSIRSWPDVDQQVPILADDVDQVVDHLVRRHVIAFFEVAIVAPRKRIQ